VSAGKLSAPALAALREVTGAVARCRAGALPPTRSRPAIGFRYDPSLDLVAPKGADAPPRPGYRPGLVAPKRQLNGRPSRGRSG